MAQHLRPILATIFANMDDEQEEVSDVAADDEDVQSTPSHA